MANVKKVSWAPDGNLCQIRRFSSEDCPAKVGLRVDDKLWSKHSHKLHSGFAYNNWSPGFLRTIMKKPEKLIRIPTIKWKCPPKVDLNSNWLVASGEQSEENGYQKKREVNVFEAVYPRLTDIPPNPSGALCFDGYLADDCNIPEIRTTPIEDEDATIDLSSVPTPTPKLDVSARQPSELINTSECANPVQTTNAGGNQDIISSDKADVGAAASAALTALLKSTEAGSSIDTDFLIDIFNNPETVSMLLHMTSTTSTKPTPEQALPSLNFSDPSTDVVSSNSASGKWGSSQIPADSSSMPPRYVPDTMVSAKTVASLSTGVGGSVMASPPMPSFRKRSQLNVLHEVPSHSVSTDTKPYTSCAAVTPKLGSPSAPTLIKDANYYKNLIKQHGSDKQNFQGKIPHTQSSSHENAYPPDYGLTKYGQKLAKKPRPCMFHNSPRGCRKGLECPFSHDRTSFYQMSSPNMTEVPNAKRMKLGRSVLTSMT